MEKILENINWQENVDEINKQFNLLLMKMMEEILRKKPTKIKAIREIGTCGEALKNTITNLMDADVEKMRAFPNKKDHHHLFNEKQF